MKSDISHPQELRFAATSLGFLLFGWFCYFLSIEGIFYYPLIAFGALTFAVGIARALWLWSKTISRSAIVAILLSIALTSLIGYMTEPTIYSGRDQGSIATAAIELANHGTLAYSTKASDAFFSRYGPGQALDFPGFFYQADGRLTTQFPLGYIAWLGGFFSLFGVVGLTVANAVLLTLSLLSIFFLIRYLSDGTFAFLGLGLAGFSFLPTWFAKFTLSENLALFLFVFLSLNLVLFLRDGYRFPFMNVILASGLLALTRIEGLVILPIALAFLYRSENGKLLTKENPLRFRTFPLISLAIILLINLSVSLPFYRTIGKALLKNLTSFGNAGSSAGHAGALVSLWGDFFSYGIAPIFLLGFLGALFLAREKKWLMLLPLALAFPSFLYLVDPAITLDHPWMLRRFLGAVWPSLLVTGVLGLALVFRAGGESLKKLTIEKRVLLAATIAILFLSQLPAFSKYLLFAENRGLATGTEAIATSIGDGDLLLVDRMATGNPYAMPTGPLAALSGKTTAYFFNAEDYAKIDTTSFDHIYLLAPSDTEAAWAASIGHDFVPVKPVLFTTSALETLPASDTRLPDPIRTTLASTLYEIKL